jgi:hypothetical protein
MPHVVPSQVVAFMESTFHPFLSTDTKTHEGTNAKQPMPARYRGQLEALLSLLEQIPNELITVDGNIYIALIANIAIIRSTLNKWETTDLVDLPLIPGLSSLNPVVVIHHALVSCPDQFPSPETTELNFLQPDDLRENLRLDISGMNRALSSGEWKAATVLAGSVVEALLLWALQQQPSEKLREAVERLRKENDPATKKPILGRKPDNELKNWVLHDFIEVGLELGVVTADTAAQARLGKDFRNLIHPGRALRLEQVCDRGTALSAVAAVELIVRDLTP